MIGTDIRHAADLLTQGQVVAIPTETVYGLAANALDEAAVVSVFSIKNRPFFDPLIIHVDSLESAARYVREIPETALRLARAYWPGPLTLLLPKNDIIPDIVTSGSPMVAVRVPAHPLALALLKTLNFPLAAPSANPFGYISPTQAEHVNKQLGGQVPYILDGGPCLVGLESTIADFSGPVPRILRLGGLSIQDMEQTLGLNISMQLSGGSNPQAPGMLDKHYAPRVQLIQSEDPAGEALKHRGTRMAFLSFGDIPLPEGIYTLNLSPSGDLSEAARHLFHYLRLLDAIDIELIIAQKLPDAGLGAAINDRLKRASVK